MVALEHTFCEICVSKYGERERGYGDHGLDDYPDHVIQSGKFPLWSARDIRTIRGTNSGMTNYKNRPGHGDSAAYGAAFHLHNWFTDINVLRNKYQTYAHGKDDINKKILSDFGNGDLDIMVRCARGISTVNAGSLEFYHHNGDVKSIKGTRPLYFMNKPWAEERHGLMQKLVAEDEKKYGSRY